MFSAFVLFLSLASASARAQTTQPAEKLFDDLFGREAKAALASGSKADDVALADKLLKAAQSLTESAELKALLCHKACDFGSAAPKGYPIAEHALDLLKDIAPNARDGREMKRLELYRQWYRVAAGAEKLDIGRKLVDQYLAAGDSRAEARAWGEASDLYRQCADLADYLKSPQKPAAAERMETAAMMLRVDQAEQKVRKDQADGASRTALLRMLVTDVDDPNRAKAFLDQSIDEVWRTYVPLAAADPQTVAADACMELGNWYRTLAAAATGKGKANASARAMRYYRLYLAKLRQGGATAEVLRQARLKVEQFAKTLGGSGGSALVILVDPNAAAAFEKGVAFIAAQQQADGAWPGMAKEQVRTTALATWALLEAGESTSDVRLVKALDWLDKQTVKDPSIAAVLCCAMEAASRQSSARYGKSLRAAVDVLVRESRLTSGKKLVRDDVHAAVLGMEAVARAKIHLPEGAWSACMKYWADLQSADGGWTATGGGAKKDESEFDASVQGATDLAACLTVLHGPELVRQLSDRRCDALRKALDYLAANAGTELKGGARGGDRMYLRLIDLARLGLLTGRKEMGKTDWYAAGKEFLLPKQGQDGSWPAIGARGPTAHTALAMLFLIRGQQAQELSALAKGPDTRPATSQPRAATPADAKLSGELDALKAKVAAGDANSPAAARQVVMLYLLELGDAVSAAEFAAKAGDDGLLDVVPLSARKVEALAEGDCMLLGEWYRSAAAGARAAGRLTALRAAQRYYAQFLKLHTAADAENLKARMRLDEVRKAAGS